MKHRTVTNAKQEVLSGSVAVTALSPSFSHGSIGDRRLSDTDIFDCNGVSVKRIAFSNSCSMGGSSVTAQAVLNDGTKIPIGGNSSGMTSSSLGGSTSNTIYPDELLTPAQITELKSFEFAWACSSGSGGSSSVSIILYGNTIHWE